MNYSRQHRAGWITIPAQLTNEDTKMTYLIVYLIAGVIYSCFEIAAVPTTNHVNWRLLPIFIMLWLPILVVKVVCLFKGTK
jgi:hypothetical protein